MKARWCGKQTLHNAWCGFIKAKWFSLVATNHTGFKQMFASLPVGLWGYRESGGGCAGALGISIKLQYNKSVVKRSLKTVANKNVPGGISLLERECHHSKQHLRCYLCVVQATGKWLQNTHHSWILSQSKKSTECEHNQGGFSYH